MEIDVKKCVEGFGDYLQRKFKDIDLHISELERPFELGVDECIRGSYNSKSLEFYVGFSGEKGETRLTVFYQLNFPNESLFSEKLNSKIGKGLCKKVKRFSKSFGKTKLSYISHEGIDIFSVYSMVNNPHNIDLNNLYEDIWENLMKPSMRQATILNSE